MTNNMNTFTLKQVKEMFLKDTQVRKANKSSNKPIIQLIEMLENDNLKITCEYTKGGTILNRGSVVECLVKLLLKDQKSARKYQNGRCDMIINHEKYEIKYSSAKGYASYSRPIQEKLIFVNQYGVYLTTGDNLVMDKCGTHIQSIKMNSTVKTLVEFQ